MATIAELLENPIKLEMKNEASAKMIEWQFRKLMGQLLLTQEHSSDLSCPCELSSEYEYCLPKHLIAIQSYAEETMPMTENGKAREVLQGIAGGANDLRRAYEEAGSEEQRPYGEITEFVRQSRKGLEPYLFTYKHSVEQLAAMKLLTKEIRGKLPPLYSQEKVEDPIVQVKFFTPDSNWTWYGIEFDGKDLFFGWVVGFEKEMGYFSLKELESARGPLGLPIERDRWFTPVRLSEVKKLHQQEVAKMTNELYRPAVFQKRMFGDEVYIFYKHAANDKQAFKTITELYQNWNLLAVASRDNDIWVLEKDASLIIDPEFLREHGVKLGEGIVAGAEMEQRPIDIRAEKLAREVLQAGVNEKITYKMASIAEEIMSELRIPPWYKVKNKAEMETPKTIRQLLQEQTILEQHQKDRPQDIIFFKDTIMKHYYPKEDFYPDSFRVVKPEPGVMVTLGCLKKNKWYPERLECVPTQDIHRTIVPRMGKYIKEAEEWAAVGVPTQHRETEVGIVPRELVEVISGS